MNRVGRINDKCSSPPQLLRIIQIEIKPFQPNSTCQSKATIEDLNAPSSGLLPYLPPPIFYFYLLESCCNLQNKCKVAIRRKWTHCHRKGPFVSHQSLRSVVVTPISLNTQLRLTLNITIRNVFQSTHAVQTCMYTRPDQKPRGLFLKYSCLSKQQLLWTVLISCSNHYCGHCKITCCSSTEPHNRDFDLLFNHLKCEYTPRSVNES